MTATDQPMSTNLQKMLKTSSVLEFKSSTFFTPILILYSNDIIAIEQSLQEKISLAPDFFKNSPLVIDVRALNKLDLDISILEITETLRKIGLFPIGVRGGNEQQNRQAQKLSLPVDTVRDYGDTSATIEETAPQAESGVKPEMSSAIETETTHKDLGSPVAVQTPAPGLSVLITQPIRSGQRVYASGDLIVMSQVSAGAEIMAEGHIHVYNTLRGRALAGVQGNVEARIFCLDLQAELVSIAGDYKTSEHFTEQMQKKPVQIFLQDHALIIKGIT